MEQRFDIHLHAFVSNSDEPAPEAMSRLFGIPPEVAERLLAALPRVVRRDAPVLQAQRIVAALESIGGRADMVACALRPAPVVVVGQAPVAEPARPELPPAHDQALAATLAMAPPTHETLKLGTQELAAFAQMPWRSSHVATASAPAIAEPAPREITVREVVAPTAVGLAAPRPSSAPAPRFAPAPAPAPSAAPPAPSYAPPSLLPPGHAHYAVSSGLDLDDSSSSSAFVVTRDLREWMRPDSKPPAEPRNAPISLVPPAQAGISLVPIALPVSGAANGTLALAASPAKRMLAALPFDDELPRVSEQLRRPALRAAEPKRRSPSVMPRPEPLRSIDPLQLTRAVAAKAQHEGLRAALVAHPAMGFSLVLGSTTFAFWLLYIVLR